MKPKSDYVPSELVVANALPQFEQGITGAAPSSYSKYVTGFFYACLMMRAEAIAAAKPVLINPEGKVVEPGMEGYWYIENFRGAYGRCNTKELLTEWSLSLDTYGDVFWYDIYDTKGQWKGFETIHGYRVAIVIDHKGTIIGYMVDYGNTTGNQYARAFDPKKFDVIEDGQVYRLKNKKTAIQPEGFDLKPEYMLAFRHPDLSNPYRGYSYVDAGKYFIEGLDLIERTRLAILRRGSIIPFIVKQIVQGSKLQEDKQKDLVKDTLNAGADEAGEILFLPPQFDVINFPMTHRDLMYLDVSIAYEKAIAQLLKIPGPLLTLDGDTGRSNTESARSQFHVQFTEPSLKSLEDSITSIHLPRHRLNGFRLELRAGVPKDQLNELKKNIQLREAAVISTNEVRTIYDFPAIDELGDELIGNKEMVTLKSIVQGATLYGAQTTEPDSSDPVGDNEDGKS